MYLKFGISGALSALALISFLLGGIVASSILMTEQVPAAQSTTSTTSTTIAKEMAPKSTNLAAALTNIRHGNETAKWVPESVIILTAADLNNTRVTRQKDLEGIASDSMIDSLSGTPQGAAISIRGISFSETSQNFEPAVALIIDRIYVDTHASQNAYLLDLEQIEISPGIPATYQGVSAFSGAISLSRSRPTAEKGSKTQRAVGTNNHAVFGLTGNLSPTDKISGEERLSDSRGNRLAINNNNNGRDENSEDQLLISASVLWQASNTLEVQYTYDNDSDNSDTPAMLNLGNTGDLLCTNLAMNQDANCAILADISAPETENLDNTSQNFSNSRGYEGHYHTARAEFDYQHHHFTNITGLQKTQASIWMQLSSTFTSPTFPPTMINLVSGFGSTRTIQILFNIC